MRHRIAARMAVEDKNSVPRMSVMVRVPASLANCGPGYDCVGLAVDLWMEVTVSRSDEFAITTKGDGSNEMPKDNSNLLVTGVKAAYETAGKPMPPLRYHAVSRITLREGTRQLECSDRRGNHRRTRPRRSQAPGVGEQEPAADHGNEQGTSGQRRAGEFCGNDLHRKK